MRTYKGACAIGMSLITGMTLAACGSGGIGAAKKAEPVVVTVWNYYNGSQQERFNNLIQEFNDSVGQKEHIIVETVSKGTIGELMQALQDSMDRMVGSESLPDVCAAYADSAFTINQAGLLADMRPYMTPDELAEYVDGYIEEGQFEADDSLKIFPIAKSTEVLTLNRTDWERFAQATGITTDQLATWEGVAEVAEQYYMWTDAQTTKPNDGKAFFGRDAFANYILLGSLQLGHEVFHVEDGVLTIDFDEASMRKLWDNYYVPYIHGYYVEDGKFRSDDLKTGNLIAYVGSTSGAPYTPTTVTYEDGTSYDITCDILPVPNFEGTAPCAVQQGVGMVLFKSDEQTERAAVTFLKWFTEAENNVAFSMSSGYLPVKKAANATEFLEKVISDQKLEVSAVLKDTLVIGMEEAQKSRMYTSKAFKDGSKARTVLNSTMNDLAKKDREAVKAMIAEGMTPEEAISRYDTEEHFKEWYDSTRQKLENME